MLQFSPLDTFSVAKTIINCLSVELIPQELIIFLFADIPFFSKGAFFFQNF